MSFVICNKALPTIPELIPRRWLLSPSGWRVVIRKPYDQRTGTFSPPLDSGEREKALEMKFSCQQPRTSSILLVWRNRHQSSRAMGFGELPDWWAHPHARRWHTLGPDPSRSHPMSGCCIFLSSVSLECKLSPVGEGSVGTPEFVVKSDGSTGTPYLGTWFLWLASEVGTVLWDWALKCVGSDAN